MSSACSPWLTRICSEIFDSVDTDRGGTISAEELSQALSNRTSGEQLEGKNLEAVMKQLDTDGEGHPKPRFFCRMCIGIWLNSISISLWQMCTQLDGA